MLQLRTLMDEEDTTWNGAKEMFSRMCGSLVIPLLPFRIPSWAGQRTSHHLPGESRRPHKALFSGRCAVFPHPPSWVRRAGLEDKFLGTLSWKDTEDQGDKGDGCQHNAQVGHSQVLGGGGPMVEEDAVQADK